VVSGVDQVGQSFVTFRLGREEFALPIIKVESIIRYELSTPVPRAPEAVAGVINMRGRIIPVVDLSRRLRDVSFEPGPQARIIIAEGEAGSVGLAVDAATEVIRVSEESILSPPENMLAAGAAEMIVGVLEVKDRLIILLDLDHAVPHTEYAGMASAVDAEGESDV
jgi:purine-binding chemotaxis protein CheW